jgi:Excalibur calcium-binding domain
MEWARWERAIRRVVPVTNFKRSTFLYRIAMRYNRGLDRDKDGIACEKL